MMYAVKYNKVNREIYKDNEDALTAAIFERLCYLPKELFQYIISNALFDTIEGLDLDQMHSITFWPNWDPKGTGNTNKVEPDVFIRTVNLDIIIEAKRHDKNQQDPNQWEREIKAYYNEYQEEDIPLVFIALGGLRSQETEEIKVSKGKHFIYKCSWKRILNIIQQVIHDMESASNYTNNNTAIINILKDIVVCFGLFGFSTALWLERFIKAPKINKESINYFSNTWTN